jgi:hypothetical protein
LRCRNDTLPARITRPIAENGSKVLNIKEIVPFSGESAAPFEGHCRVCRSECRLRRAVGALPPDVA